MFCFVYVCVLNMNLSFNKSHEHFHVLSLDIVFGLEDDSGRQVHHHKECSCFQPQVFSKRNCLPERQAHLQSLTWKDFLVDRMSDRFLFLKARFFGLQISMKFYERHGIHVFCFFLVVFVSGRNPSRKKTGADEICC